MFRYFSFVVFFFTALVSVQSQVVIIDEGCPPDAPACLQNITNPLGVGSYEFGNVAASLITISGLATVALSQRFLDRNTVLL